ncbi:hypothetical protein JTE90_016334 [Oedothorax gibbosus]|uniref:Uncharacterized protein n=1 Tax=Oedothorax gibbosus TaxID=931172 RepID=A0AAV6TPR6_9ARAC|nr:hypothetical protein JTE90_016334 [Oedothorax gibbosus]
MWLAFAWMSVSSADPPTPFHMQIQMPIFKQYCSSQQVKCVDDCSFLCVEKSSKCIGGMCVVDKYPNRIPCDTDKGGMLMMGADQSWKCLCTEESIWSGPACDRLNPDVCERGVFLYKTRDSAMCVCPFPYKKILVHGKWHCLGNPEYNFFKEAHGLVDETVGPSLLRRP